MVWPALTVIGFLALIALIIKLGTVSTDRYEREKRDRAGPARFAPRSIMAVGRSIGVPGTT